MNNWEKYFGTPERAAATMYGICEAELCGDNCERHCAMAEVVCCVDGDARKMLESEADHVD